MTAKAKAQAKKVARPAQPTRPSAQKKASPRGAAPPWLMAFESGAPEALDEVFARDLVLHFSDSLLKRLPEGLTGLRQLAALLKTAFPDLRWHVISVSGQAQTHVYTCSARGTHRGPFLRVQPTGR